MTRSDSHRDALARELGATHYKSGHGEAAADASRALDPAEGHAPERGVHGHARGEGKPHYGRWQQRVRDVMTTSVVTVDRRTPYKRIAVLLAQHQISAMPVLVLGGHIAGVVSEADLISAQERRLREALLESGGHFRRHAGVKKHRGLTAGELMTSPAITTHPDAPLPVAARLMSSRHIKRLPVVEVGTAFGGGVGGKVVGIVSRCDLLSVYLRPDKEIASHVREMLAQLPEADTGGVTAEVRNGVVTLTGMLGSAEEHDLIRVAGRLTWDIDGVVDVVNNLGTTQPATSSSTPQHGDMPLKPEEFLDVLTKPEELIGRLAKPGEFIASAYDFAEQMLTSQRKFAEGMVEATKPLLGGTEGAQAKKDHAEAAERDDPE
jgi:CBS domain-containing protein